MKKIRLAFMLVVVCLSSSDAFEPGFEKAALAILGTQEKSACISDEDWFQCGPSLRVHFSNVQSGSLEVSQITIAQSLKHTWSVSDRSRVIGEMVAAIRLAPDWPCIVRAPADFQLPECTYPSALKPVKALIRVSSIVGNRTEATITLGWTTPDVEVAIPGVFHCEQSADCVLAYDCRSVNRRLESAYVKWTRENPPAEDDSMCLQQMQYDYGPCAVCSDKKRCGSRSDCRGLRN